MEAALQAEWAEWCGASVAEKRGLYVAPAASGDAWHGLMFIASGAFQGATFAFALSIPRDYPAALPRCRFFTTVLHPDVRDQVLDLSAHEAAWADDPHKLILTLRTLRETFESWNPPDPNMARAAKSCAERAVDVRHAGLPRDFAIPISEYQPAKHAQTKHDLLRDAASAPPPAAGAASDFFQRLMANQRTD